MSNQIVVLTALILILRLRFGRDGRTIACSMVHTGQQEERFAAETDAVKYIVSAVLCQILTNVEYNLDFFSL